MDSPSVALTLRLPADLHRKLSAVAIAETSSLNREIIIAVRSHIDAHHRAASTRSTRA